MSKNPLGAPSGGEMNPKWSICLIRGVFWAIFHACTIHLALRLRDPPLGRTAGLSATM